MHMMCKRTKNNKPPTSDERGREGGRGEEGRERGRVGRREGGRERRRLLLPSPTHEVFQVHSSGLISAGSSFIMRQSKL